VAALAGPMVSNEGLYMLQRLFREVLGSHNLDHRWTKALLNAEERAKFGSRKTPIADFELKSSVLIFGSSLADEEPILFLRIRKAWFQNATKVVVASDRPTDADSFAHVVLRYKSGTEADLARCLLAACSGRDFDCSSTGVPADKIKEAGSILGQNSVVVTTQAILNQDNGREGLNAALEFAESIGAEFNLYALGANDQGAIEIGVLPDGMPGGVAMEGQVGLATHDILAACADGRLQALWLVGCDPFSLHHDRNLVEKALETVPFLVVQDIIETESTHFASIVLPMEAPAEHDGTYTNLERRVQRMRPIVSAPGDAKPAWRVFAEAMVRSKPQTPFFNPSEVMDDLGKVAPVFAAAAYSNLDGEGVILG
jgi:NADH-quinone oxidoreductase subunit G